MDNPAALILTLAFAEADQARFEALRRAHFPPERNLIPAHATLFHHLPGEQLAAVQQRLTERCAAQAGFAVDISGLRSLGRGVAFALSSPELARLRADLADAWAPWLTSQDRQGYRPHVTIQNKAAPEQARALLGRMQAEFSPFTIGAAGLLLWHYRGGPWELASRHDFTGSDSPG